MPGSATPPTTPPSTSVRLDTDRVEVAARALLDDKITAVRVLAVARQARENARAALAAAEREDTAAYTAALRAGWTADELKRVGLDAPTTRTPGRPRGTRPRARPAAGQDTGQGTGPGAEHEPGPGAEPAGRSAAAASSTGPGSSTAGSPNG